MSGGGPTFPKSALDRQTAVGISRIARGSGDTRLDTTPEPGLAPSRVGMTQHISGSIDRTRCRVDASMHRSCSLCCASGRGCPGVRTAVRGNGHEEHDSPRLLQTSGEQDSVCHTQEERRGRRAGVRSQRVTGRRQL